MSILKVNKNNFESEIIKSDKTVLLDFWASWCGPCRMVSPVVEEIAEENPSIQVGKVNVDEEPGLAQAFQVMSIPTLVVMKNGKVVRQAVGNLFLSMILMPPRECSTIPSAAKYFSIRETTSRAEPIYFAI